MPSLTETLSGGFCSDVRRLTDEEVADLIDGIAELVPEDDSPSDWLLEEMIHPGITVITGQPERGKTTLLIAMCKALLGAGWCGEPVLFDQSKRILFGCEDRISAREVRRAVEDDPRLVACQLTGWNSEDLGEKLRRSDFGLLVLDSLTAVVRDVNDQSEATGFTRFLRQLPVPVVVVHHSAVNSSKGPSGAQAYRAAYRHTIDVQRITAADHDLVLQLRLSGNDIAPRVDWLGVNRSSHVVRRVAKPAGAATTVKSAGRSGPDKKGAILLREADRQGLDWSRQDHNAIATGLLGGARGKEDPDLCLRVGQLLGRQSVGHRGVVEILRTHLPAARAAVTA